jgi:3-hydroxyacyl-CoA dehydrogenase
MSNAVTFSKYGTIGVIAVNNPPVNATSQQVRAGLQECVEQGVADNDVAALVIRCEGSTFIAGADIREFGKPPMDPRLWDVVRFIEASKKPVVAAIHGFALGGGLEVALGCHFRIATPGAKLGLPEVKLGILPGAGGTQRLPRLIGAKAALDMIVSGAPASAKKALDLGLVDEVVEGELLEAALRFARDVVAEKRPARRVSDLPVHFDSPGLFEQYRDSIAKKQRGFLAPFACIKAVQGAVELPFSEGMKLERSLFVELAASSHAKAQQHVFFAEREVAKLPGVAPEVKPREVNTVGVVGSGTMGGGIGMCFANAAIPVVLLDTSQENLDRGMNTIRRNYANSVKNGNLAESEMAKRLQRITPTLAFDDLTNADLVIEAVFEEMDVKRDVFSKLDAVCKPGAILASNTSYLNINEIAASTSRPQDVLGMHFFSPANVMKLLENVRGEKTAPDAYVTAMKVGKAIGKVAVLVGVCDGFVGNRMLSKRGREAYFMLEEGATPHQVDKALYDFGFPMGPFAMGDLAGLDVAWRNRKAKFDKLTAREQACDILDQICGSGRYGQKTGSGFYRYDEKRNAVPDPAVDEIIDSHSKKLGIDRREISEQEIIERCLYSMINEGAKILEEGIAARPLDIDIVWINGYGFPAYHGGPMFYADQVGLKLIYEAILKYQDQFGSQYWKPAPLLEKLAREGKGFYSA